MDPKSRDDFRIAIICALPLEATAVLDLFDQRYDKGGSKYGKQEEDINTYTIGRIGRHDVVLVHMSGMGPIDATRVASNIRLSFKCIRLALIVDICGGVPQQSVILGDVIISNSVVEFHTGRHYPDRVQARSGLLHTLGRPNPQIRALLGKFEIPLIRKELEAEIQQTLADLCKKSDTAQYPGVEDDRLFAASYRHMHRKETSQQECLCISSRSNSDPVCDKALKSSCDALGCDADSSETPSRRMRFASGVPTPLVHIGTVATTTVMKSGEHRDIIARENDVIAFEMEGAGVWEDLPCVIIKGVCDYADSHKNKKWQDYAAATAASAAKAFLDHWTSKQHDPVAAEGSSRKRPLSISDEDDARPSRRVCPQSLFKRQSSISDLDRTDQTNSNSLFVPALGDLNVRQFSLDALNFEQLDTRHATIKAAHTATCEWLLNKSEYTNWQDEKKLHEHHGFLWIKGKPGAGKSTIMKFAYTNAKENFRGSVAISCFFNARGEALEKSTRGMYRSLLLQLLSKIPKIQAVLDTTEAATLQKTSPDLWTVETLQSLFRQAIERLGDQHLTCFVDALDECEDNEDQVREMIYFFEVLGEHAVKNKIRFLVCFSSRHYPHITIDKSAEFTLEVQQEHSEDITKYTNSKLKIGRNRKCDQIKIDVQQKSQGIFLWVVLVVSILQRVWDHGKIDDLDDCLKNLPKDLDALFRDILGRDAQNMENLVLCLKWILYAERPLRPAELYFATLSASETVPVKPWDPDRVTPEDISRFILSSSKGLAEPTRSNTPTIQFIHESVRDFLLKENGLALLQTDVDCTSAGPIHDLLKKGCQRYLISVPTDLYREPLSELARMFPFLDYSIRYIFMHAELAASHGIPQRDFLRDFPLEEWISLHDRIEMYKIRRYGSARSLLYIFTERNLFHLFQVEVGQGQAINVKGGQYDFPIIAAALGNIQMLELLLEHGADPNKRGEGYKHAVFAAVDKSNAPALEVLIRHDAVSPISSTRDFFSALLSLAVKRKNVLITKLLLQYREGSAAEGVCAPQHFRSLIEDAIDNESDEILQILIKSGVIGPALPDDCCFALVKASTNGKEALVRRFLDKSGPCYAGDDAIFSGQPLLAAAKHNHEAIVRILIDNGADINALDRDGSAPLHVACIDGDKATVRIMLNNGAEVNMLDSYERTGLHWACDKKHEAIVRILLDNGVDINTRDRDGRTGFHWACYRRSEAIVRILLDDGADINAMDQTGRTGLYWACHWGHEAIVRILLDNGADVNRGDSRFAVFVSRLVSCDVRENIMSTLLKYGADPNQYSLDRDLLLHRALAMGMTNIVKLLLDHGADVHIPSSKYEDASRALNSCADPEKRAACETLLLEKSVERSSVPYLTWVNGTAYLNFTQQTF